MDKRIYICAAIILVFAVLALLAHNYLEIYQRTVPAGWSRDAYNNSYLAMERWLNESGHPVRVENDYNPAKISAIPEKVAVVLAAAFDWNCAQEFLVPWIESGNFLIICLNVHDEDEIDYELFDFLSYYGAKPEITYVTGKFQGENIPDFNWIIHFIIDEDAQINTIADNEGYVRLAEVPLGEGVLTVTGSPLFMNNYYLDREINARLAWSLTGERAAGENTGVVFVRNRYISKSLFGKIMERGNLVPVIVSALLLIFLGFWMVIPVFGLVLEEKQKNSRPIRERFAAETSFLKKYKGLDYYLKVYERELQHGNIAEEDNYDYSELINKLKRYNDGTDKLKRRIGSFKAGTGKE